MSKLTASEALYGFVAWLTTRDECTLMGSSHNAAPIPPLVEKFCQENGFDDPRPGWEENLVHPVNESEEEQSLGSFESVDSSTFKSELKSLLNHWSQENGSDTPDFILANYVDSCIKTFDEATRAREKWYGREKSLTQTISSPG